MNVIFAEELFHFHLPASKNVGFPGGQPQGTSPGCPRPTVMPIYEEHNGFDESLRASFTCKNGSVGGERIRRVNCRQAALGRSEYESKYV